MSDNVTQFPVKLTPVQEACQRILEYNPKLLIAIMQDEDGNVSFLLPPGELWTNVLGAIEVAKFYIQAEAAGIE